MEDRHQRFGQRHGSDERGGAAVAEDVGVLFAIEQRVERQRHNASAHSAPECHGKIDRVVEQKRKPLLRPQSGIQKRGSEPAAARLQIAVSQRPVGIDESGFAGKTALDRPIDKISDGIVWPSLQQVLQHGRSPPGAGPVSRPHTCSRQSLMRRDGWRNAPRRAAPLKPCRSRVVAQALLASRSVLEEIRGNENTPRRIRRWTSFLCVPDSVRNCVA